MPNFEILNMPNFEILNMPNFVINYKHLSQQHRSQLSSQFNNA
jgi:hypothetical protein